MKIDKVQIEKKLIPRLKVLGIVLLFFSLIAISYSFFPNNPENPLEDEISLDFTDPPPMNMYLVAAAFCSVGATCITIAWRKKNAFKESDSDRG